MKSRSLIILCRSLLSSLIVAASGRRRLPLQVKNNITLMNIRNKLGALSSLLVLGLSAAPSSALVIMISDLVPADSAGNIETFFSTNFTNVTEIRHSNWANFNAATTQDALNGTGTFAGGGAADVVIIGRSLASGDYDNFDASGYNSLTIPVVSLTSYTVRQNGNRMGWHGSSTTTGQQVGGNESLVTAAGGPILGLGVGTHDLLSAVAAAADNFNGLGQGTTAFGGGTILASVGGDTLAAYWAIGSAPGNPGAATVDVFPGARLLFNTDNDPNSGNNGANDLANMTPAGTQALINAIAFATPLTVADPGPDDADADDLLDEWERLWGGGSLGILSGLAGANADGDSLTDLEEFNLRDQFPNLDPTKADSDSDTLDDGDELAGAGARPATDPTNPDTDGDGLDDAAESNTGSFVSATDTGTDPTSIDTDGDGFDDGTELAGGSNPTDPDDAPAPSSALVVMLSDLVPADSAGNIETFFSTNFTNVTEIRHSNWANFNAATTQDALNGTGAFAGGGAADVVIIGRSLASGDYDNFDASGYNSLAIPVVSLTSYTVRQNGNRMGWHGSSTTTGQLIGGDESLVTADGAAILGLAAGTHDLLSAVAAAADNFNGLGQGTTAFGGGTILASVGGDTLAAYWAIGSAPGNPGAATVDVFPGARLLFNTDNDPNSGNNGANDLANMTPAGTQALINAIAFATPLTVADPGPDDADADDLLDEWERLWGGGSLGILSGLAGANADGDSLTDLEEFNLRDQFPNLDPTKADSDSDTLDDGDELAGAGARPATDPTNPDTDGDGLDDAAESNTGSFVSATDTGTDPTSIDSDGDSYPDALELETNSNPTDPNSTPSLRALLCAYWPLDEVQGSPGTLTTPDQANGQDLDLVNLDGTNLIAGRFDKAFSFSNAAQTMLTRVSGVGDLLPVTKNSAYTVSLWINATGTGQNDLRFFSEASTTTNNPLFNIGTHSGGSNGAVDMYIRNSTNANGGHDRSLVEPFDGNGWRHVAVVVDTIAQTVIVYIDGVADLGVFTYIDVYAPVMNTTTIGGILRAGPSHWVTGGIDEVSLWKTALSPEDVERLAGGATVAELLNPTRLDVNFTRNGNDLVIDWASQAGKRYNLRSETDLSVADPVDWAIYDGKMEIMATPPENTLTTPLPADAKRFFVIEEFPAPPVTVFSENFDGADPGWTTGFDALDTDMNTIWELGDPVGGPVTAPSAANSAPNCYGTNLTENYGISSNTWLRTPNIDLTAAPGATLVFQQWLDMDEFDNLDRGMVRVLDASVLPGTVTELGVVQANITGFLDGWVAFSAELPAAALGQVISLEFGFVSDGDDIFDASGWYIDDVIVTMPGS